MSDDAPASGPAVVRTPQQLQALVEPLGGLRGMEVAERTRHALGYALGVQDREQGYTVSRALLESIAVPVVAGYVQALRRQPLAPIDALHRQQQQELRRLARSNDAFWMQLFDGAEDGLLLLALDGRVRALNPAAESLLLVRRDEVVGRRIQDEVPALSEVFSDLIDGSRQSEVGVEASLVAPEDGRAIAAKARRAIDVGEVTQVLVAMRDVSEVQEQDAQAVVKAVATERANMALVAHQSQRLLAALGSVRLGIAIVGANGRIAEANDALVQLLGAESARPGVELRQLLAELDVELGPGDTLDPTRGYRLDRVSRDGDAVVLEMRVGPKLPDGIQVLEVQDITLRSLADQRLREREAQLIQAQKLEAVGRLAGGMAHDFNNLLTVITGFAELLEGKGVDRAAEAIVGAAERGAALTQQLLAFSRRQVLHSQVLDLGELVRDVSRLLTRLVADDIQVSVNVSPGLWRVRADPTQMEQVLLNLAVNAGDAMPDGGLLELSLFNRSAEQMRALGFPEESCADHVLLAVSDTGTGMDEDTRAHVFEPFFTTKVQGTGLGLATVYGIVQQSGGRISLRSAAGEGSTFRVFLPRVHDEVHARPSESTTRRADLAGEETVLIVEDNAEIRKVYADLLRQHGYEVHTAGNGLEGIRVANGVEGGIDILLTDVVMPVMSGPESAVVLQRILPHLRVVFMSGYTGPDGQTKRLPDDAVLLEKPFSMDALLRTLRDVLDG